ncbi:MAG TPA: hypothetical protein VL282_06010 [Tepidisphaeraceae bacterium]|nr:hypothetical protein [Tepidisphaeraceae bacterium]
MLAVLAALAALTALAADVRNVQLFVDDSVIEQMKGAKLVLHAPERREVACTFDAPWEGEQSAYVSVMKLSNEFRLYYRGGGDLTEEQTCMAESPDGVHWMRPELGLYAFKGSKKNNIVFKPKEKSYRESHNFAPFLDTRPGVADDARFKAVALGRLYDKDGTGHRVLHAMVSPDGMHWKRLRDEPVMTEGSFDSLNTVFFDSRIGKYVCYLRAGRDGKRAVQRSMSDDFIQWSKPEWLEYGSAPLEQFYTNGITPYFRNPSIYIGLPMRFVPERKTIGIDRSAIDGLSDAVFISSHDGLNFDRQFMEAFIRPGLDPANWGNAHGNNTPAWGIVQTSDSEMSIYWAEHYGKTPRIVRGALRLDGFASLHAGAAGGEVLTKPIALDGKKLILNCSTSAIGSIKIELQNKDGEPVPGFALTDADEIYGDEINRVVAWRSATTLPATSGPVRLHILLKDADVYSLRFSAE